MLVIIMTGHNKGNAAWVYSANIAIKTRVLFAL